MRSHLLSLWKGSSLWWLSKHSTTWAYKSHVSEASTFHSPAPIALFNVMQNCIQSNFKSSHDLLKVFTWFKGPKFKVSDLWQSLTITLGKVKMQTTCNIQWHRLYITIYYYLEREHSEEVLDQSTPENQQGRVHILYFCVWYHLMSEWSVGLQHTSFCWAGSTRSLKLSLACIPQLWHPQHLEVSKAVQASSSQLHHCLLWTSMQGYLWHTPGLRLFLLVSEGDPQPLSCILDSRTIEPYSWSCQVWSLVGRNLAPWSNYIYISVLLIVLFSTYAFSPFHRLET